MSSIKKERIFEESAYKTCAYCLNLSVSNCKFWYFKSIGRDCIIF